MARPVVALPHPLVDSSGPGWAVHETSAPLVALTSGRSALLVDAVRAGSRVALVTTPTSRLTFPLFHLLGRLGGAWLTRDAEGVLRHAVGGRVVPDASVLVDPRRVEEYPAPVDDPTTIPLRSDGADFVPWVQMTVAVTHRARIETRLGGVVAAVAESMAEVRPRAWGGVEPAAAPFDRDAITGIARAHLPADSRFIVSGPRDTPFSAVVRASRSETGVVEETRIVLPRPQSDGVLHETVLDVLVRLAARFDVLMGTAWTLRGPADATIAPYWPTVPQPVAAILGARAVRSMDVTPETFSGEIDAVRVGNRRAPALALGFGGDDVGWDRFRDAVRAVGVDALTEALLPAGLTVGGPGRSA